MCLNINKNNVKITDVISAEKGQDITLPEPELEGYDFAGWYQDGEYISHISKFEENTVLEAKWLEEDRQEIVLSFVGATGEVIRTANIKCGGIIGDVLYTYVTPFRDGYLFDGWQDETGKKVGYDTIVECHDITLTAMWNEIILSKK